MPQHGSQGSQCRQRQQISRSHGRRQHRRNEDSQRPLQQIDDQHQGSGALTQYAKDIRRPDVPAANLSDVDPHRAGNQKARRQRTGKVGKNQSDEQCSNHYGRGCTGQLPAAPSGECLRIGNTELK